MIFSVMTNCNGSAYRKIGPFWGNMMTTLRLSLGDFDFSVLDDDSMGVPQHALFWITWVVMVNFSLLIFLNFIIAEVSNSYTKVRERIDAQIYKERAKLISEAEDVIGESAKADLIKFPKYIIARELEEWTKSI